MVFKEAMPTIPSGKFDKINCTWFHTFSNKCVYRIS